MAEKQHVRGACPLDCPDTCSWIVTVEAGRAVKLEGDRAHPFTRGALCNKLNDYIAYTQSPGRLLYPMRRVGPKGGGSFKRISWGEALAEISARLLRISEEFGATVNATVDDRSDPLMIVEGSAFGHSDLIPITRYHLINEAITHKAQN
jgi:anaerobic selenocysteine-containing dehydrogenase